MHAVPTQSLDDLLVAQGARLRSHRSSSCLLCGGTVRVQRGAAGDRFRCVGCGTEIAHLRGGAGVARRAA
jgi:tRNA(Ile2) C34 agmatinyltransferase TiaS